MTDYDFSQLILVDEEDRALGTAEKLAAHQQGLLHRAFSIFIVNGKGELLLQQRAMGKYHSGGLWTNTCCSHPAPGEDTEAAAHRRLQEEMGFDAALKPVFVLRYQAEVGNDLVENEYDHVYAGSYEGEVTTNPEEAMDWKWIGSEKLKQWVAERPEDFTKWFLLALPMFESGRGSSL